MEVVIPFLKYVTCFKFIVCLDCRCSAMVVASCDACTHECAIHLAHGWLDDFVQKSKPGLSANLRPCIGLRLNRGTKDLGEGFADG